MPEIINNENLSIGLSSNWLTVSGNTLRADVLKNSRSDRLDVSAKELGSVLLLGRRSIVQGIEEFYAEQRLKHPDATVVRPSVWTAQLGTTAQTDGPNSRVFTEKGIANGGINLSRDEIQPAFHEHWNAVWEAGFLPEVRRTSTARSGGSWLLLRKPELSDVLHHWFGLPVGTVRDVAGQVADSDKSTRQQYLTQYRMKAEESVDRAPDERRSREQIGLILSMAAIKSALDDRYGYEEELDDAFTYIDNDTGIDPSTVRAVENSTFELG